MSFQSVKSPEGYFMAVKKSKTSLGIVFYSYLKDPAFTAV